jgi:hypothetical protein
VNAPTFPVSLESMLRRDAAEARRAFVVVLAINLVCMAVAGWLL